MTSKEALSILIGKEDLDEQQITIAICILTRTIDVYEKILQVFDNDFKNYSVVIKRNNPNLNFVKMLNVYKGFIKESREVSSILLKHLILNDNHFELNNDMDENELKILTKWYKENK